MIACAQQQVVWRWDYSGFGEIAAQATTIKQTTNPTNQAPKSLQVNLRYPGQYFDKESGLHYNWHRSYDQHTGRYTQADPIGLNGGWNRFGYANANALRFVDPNGLWAIYDDIAFVAGGTAIGLAGRLVGDMITGEWSTASEYAGAAAGGAMGGIALLYTANPYIAGAAAGATSNITTQALNLSVTKTQCQFDWTSLAFDTAVGTATGRLTGRPIQGINAGRGSYLQIFKQIRTKAINKSISRIRPKTAGKMVVGAFHHNAIPQGSLTGSLASSFYSTYLTDSN